MKTLAKISASFLLCSVATTTFAQDSETPPPPPQAPPAICFENERFSDFDFWVGEWNVYGQHPQTGERILAGTNSITKHYANCLIMETWENAGGAGGGFSMNFYDPIEDQWRQVWVSPNLSISSHLISSSDRSGSRSS